MAEEEKKTEKEQTKVETKKEEAQKPVASVEAPPAEKKEAAEKKKKKINCLTLKELEKKIEQTQEKMGGLTSFYARQLLKRKEQLLTGNPEKTE